MPAFRRRSDSQMDCVLSLLIVGLNAKFLDHAENHQNVAGVYAPVACAVQGDVSSGVILSSY